MSWFTVFAMVAGAMFVIVIVLAFINAATNPRNYGRKE